MQTTSHNWRMRVGWQGVLKMLRSGMDTMDIAIACRVPEYVVYNLLAKRAGQ